MDQTTATQLATLLHGQAHQSAPNLWHVIIARDDGGIVAFYGGQIAEYEDRASFDADAATRRIRLGEGD